MWRLSILLLFVASPALAATGQDTSLWTDFLSWVIQQQREFHRELTEGLKTLRESDSLAAAWPLILASFLYGVFHAAGPGHGKVVLTTYLLTQREKLMRGVIMAAAAAFMQGVVAIILVYGLIYLAGWLPRETSEAVTWSERMSYALVALIGVMLVWRTARQLGRMRPRKRHSHDHVHHHDHHDHQDHDHGPECGCGHDHAPDPNQLDGSWKTAIGVITSIGLRPCSGAVLVLVFAKALNLNLAGVAAVAAMSLGTAIAVALLALVAVNARALAGRLVAGSSSRIWSWGALSAALGGGVLLVMLGANLLVNSWQAVHPLGL